MLGAATAVLGLLACILLSRLIAQLRGRWATRRWLDRQHGRPGEASAVSEEPSSAFRVGDIPDPLPRGFRFNRYVVEAELGQGPMGTVYRACDAQMKRPIALYVLEPKRRTEVGSGRFLRWIQMAVLGEADVLPPCEGSSFPILDVVEVDGIYAAAMLCTNEASEPKE